jgi:hypothetical protein
MPTKVTAASRALMNPMANSHRLRGHAQVVGDPVLGIYLLLIGHGEAVVALLGKPACQKFADQPLAPFHLKRHAAPHHGHRKRGSHRDQNDNGEHERENCSCVLGFEGIEKPFVPSVDADVDGQIGEDENECAGRPEPSPRRIRPCPKSRRAL